MSNCKCFFADGYSPQLRWRPAILRALAHFNTLALGQDPGWVDSRWGLGAYGLARLAGFMGSRASEVFVFAGFGVGGFGVSCGIWARGLLQALITGFTGFLSWCFPVWGLRVWSGAGSED